MNSVFRGLIAFAAVLAAGQALADTLLMNNSTTIDGRIISKENGLIRMQSGDHEVVVPEADVAGIETNDKAGQEVNWDDVERMAQERDKELVDKTGLQAPDRAAVDEILKWLFLGDEDNCKNARKALLEMVKDRNPFRYLALLLPEINPMKVAPLLEVMFEMNPDGMREILEQYVTNNSETARAASLRCLATLRGNPVLELMKRGLVDEYPEVRTAAIRGIQAFGAREATPLLIKAMKEDDEVRVQNAARDVLSSLWTEPGQPPPSFLQNAGWDEFWKSKSAGVPGAWDLAAIEPLVPKGTVVQLD